jgi:hypothetical protein
MNESKQGLVYCPTDGYSDDDGHVAFPTMQPNSGTGQCHVMVNNVQDDMPFMWSWSNMVCSILSMICCCAPIGLVASVLAAKAKVSHGMNQFRKSRREMDIARQLAIAALIVGIVFIVLIIFIEVMAYYTIRNLSAQAENMN